MKLNYIIIFIYCENYCVVRYGIGWEDHPDDDLFARLDTNQPIQITVAIRPPIPSPIYAPVLVS